MITDEQLIAAYRAGFDGRRAFDSHLYGLRAVAALLRTQQDGQWRQLKRGEPIQIGDEGLQDDCVTWLPIAGWEVRMTYDPCALNPMRRAITTPPQGATHEA